MRKNLEDSKRETAFYAVSVHREALSRFREMYACFETSGFTLPGERQQEWKESLAFSIFKWNFTNSMI